MFVSVCSLAPLFFQAPFPKPIHCWQVYTVSHNSTTSTDQPWELNAVYAWYQNCLCRCLTHIVFLGVFYCVFICLFLTCTAENIKTLEKPPPGQHYDIIVLDGTWRQAKDIFTNNPFLCQARQVSFSRQFLALPGFLAFSSHLLFTAAMQATPQFNVTFNMLFYLSITFDVPLQVM